ncbi:putative uncharacterized protein DDB_G0287975 [Momordica charantia]|uniref:Chromosome transmission fidelity protein 8 homolog n=1 Tax=Momordica charantia TaxID=3673 RepID=A0A6J1E2M4_MOMCH|nr:putative uncharacterized protein DDB_G0287975 [Momordica charantia]
MQIKVKCNCGETNCLEWAVVELQGVVEPQSSFQDRLQNLEIGVLCRPSAQEVFTFTVGYHELTGSKVPLKKPLLVLKKKTSVNEDQSSDSNSTSAELEVIGIIRQRILFKTRPKALISKPQPLVKERSRCSSAVTDQTA